MEIERYKKTIDGIKQAIKTNGIKFEYLEDMFEIAKSLEKEHTCEREYALKLTNFVKLHSAHLAQKEQNEDYANLYWAVLLYEAPIVFDSYLRYLEKNRPHNKRFYEPREKVLKIVVDDLQDLADGKISFYGLSLPPRVGKLISDDTPVLTTKGWKNHGDLEVGDFVYGIDGAPKPIIYVFPKNFANKRVWFSDNSYIDCNEEHEWLVRSPCLENSFRKTTRELEVKRRKGLYCDYYLPRYQAIIGEEKELPVEPYTFGAWIGDGKKDNAHILVTDPAVIDKIIDKGYFMTRKISRNYGVNGEKTVTYCEFRELKKGLRKMGLCYKKDRKKGSGFIDKHIPDIYMCASYTQRLELLAGLIDTYGRVSPCKKFYIIEIYSKRLRDDFISLVSTFGWKCMVKKAPRERTYGIAWQYALQFAPDVELPVVAEKSKAFRVGEAERRGFGFARVEDLDEPTPGKCIAVKDGTYRVGKKLIPTHNSTLCIFYLTWRMGKNPNSHSAMGGHSGILAKGFYKEVLNIITSKEYTFNEIFPEIKLESKSADEFTINLDTPDRFPTLTCRGIDGTWTGAIDISSDGLLYVDDLVRDRTESLSPIRLDNKYQDYLNVMVDRKNDGAGELMVGTRWNPYDPLGRVEENNKDNPKYRFRKIPALNENDESNFNYLFGVGFSTEYYRDMRERLDPNEWQAKYQQSPFIREGLVFPESSLKTFNGTVPEGNFTRVVSVCDVAWGGGDSLSMPIGYEYDNGEIYIIDWIFSTGKKEVTIPLVVAKIKEHNIQQINFEANNGGQMYATYINDMLISQGFKCSITSTQAPTQMSKLAKILQYSGDITRNFYFLTEDKRSDEYRKAMTELTTFTQVGKNPHDDAPDSLAQLASFAENGIYAHFKAVRRPC